LIDFDAVVAAITREPVIHAFLVVIVSGFDKVPTLIKNGFNSAGVFVEGSEFVEFAAKIAFFGFESLLADGLALDHSDYQHVSFSVCVLLLMW
jgi:hypothetical protein